MTMLRTTKSAFLLALGVYFPFGTQASAQEVTAAARQNAAAVTQPQAAAPKPPSEVETFRAEAASLREQLDRQHVIADNARAQLDQARAEIRRKDELLALGRTRNAELLLLGREILDRYRRKDFGAVLAGAEPFTQLTRVKLENLAQDYEDKLRAARFTTDTLPPSVEAKMKADLAVGPDGQPAPAPQNP
jgi:hypothetical protein